jgi:hypothetical protein
LIVAFPVIVALVLTIKDETVVSGSFEAIVASVTFLTADPLTSLIRNSSSEAGVESSVCNPIKSGSGEAPVTWLLRSDAVSVCPVVKGETPD